MRLQTPSFSSVSGVSAALLFCLLTAAAPAGAAHAPYPEPGAGYVTDNAGLLSPEQEERIERWLLQVEKKKNIEIIVVTIGSVKDYPGTASGSIETFAAGMYNSYGVGNLPANDGVLLLVAKNDRAVRIQLGSGYAPGRDADARRIIDDTIVPAFKKGEFAGGITEGMRGIIREFAGMTIGLRWDLILALGGGIVLLLISLSLFLTGKRGWGWVFLGLALVLILWMVKTIMELLNNQSEKWKPGGRGGFGGGSTSGGGASGSW